MSDTRSSRDATTIKKYANRRLYNTATSTYVTLQDLAAMVKAGEEFNVYDAKSGEDLTRSVLTQIIVEEEGRSGQSLLPVSFLRQLIGFYGNNMQWMVPKYLEHSMEMLSSNQKQLRDYFQTTFGGMFPFGSTLEEMSKQNLAMFERALRMFSPFNTGMAANLSKAATEAAESMARASDEAMARMTEQTTVVATTMAQAIEAAAIDEPELEPAPEPIAKAIKAARTEAPIEKPVASVTNLATALRSVEPPAPTAATSTPMPNVQSATTAASPPSADDMQQKIASLQRQLADLAKGRG
jgi:polyhydroxyalkanoate synthesis repressor PhaR